MPASPRRLLPVLLLACASGLAAESRRSAIPAPVPAPVLADRREGAPRMAPVRWGLPEGAAAEVRPVAAPAEETLLDEVGRLRRQVQPAEPWLWKAELARPGTLARQAWLHLRLGEWKLAGTEQPEAARWHFRRAQRLAPAGDPAQGLARLNDGIALFYLRGYREAADAFAALQEPGQAPKGLDPRRVTLWHRLADRTAAYHEANGRLGIPQSSRLNPECGASALSVALEAIGLPHDRKAVLRHTRVTGMGSTVPDLVAAADKLGAEGRAVRADEQGFRALPKPLVAHVESDHFVAVVRADAKGVAYRCGHCGAWPGGERTLTWKQWRAMRPGLFVTVTRTRSAASRALTAALKASEGTERKGLRLAATGLRGLGPEVSSLSLLLRGHVFQWLPSPIPPGCGVRPSAQGGLPWMNPPVSAPSGNTFAGDPVNLATGEEAYEAPPDLTVYNPRGPAVVWQRSYNSLRNLGAAECDSFGLGWSHAYNSLVDDPAMMMRSQIAQGTLWVVPPTTHEAPGAGLNWDISLDGSVVATSASPNGWAVTYDPSGIYVTVAPGATIAARYKVRSVSGTSFRPSGYFDVRAYNAVPQAGGARTPITGQDVPASGTGWDIVKDGVVVATSADPRGWAVLFFPNDNEFEVQAPLTAPVGGSYVARRYEFYPYYRGFSAPFSVVPHSVEPAPGTKYLVFPNGSRMPFSAGIVPSAGSPQVACGVDPGAPVKVWWEYDPANPCGFFTVLHADGTRWVLGNDDWDGNTGQLHPLVRIINRTGQALALTYAPTRHWTSRMPLLARISDAASGSTLLTINRAAQNRGMILNVTDCYGRAVYYAHNSNAVQVDYVSQIVTPGTLNAPARWGYGYTYLQKDFHVNGWFLTSLTTPSPTGTGWSTAQLQYDPQTFVVTRSVDANGNKLEYTATSASHTQVTAKDPQGNTVFTYTVGFDSLMNETTRTDGTNVTVVSTLEHNDPNNPHRPSAVIDANNRRTELTWDGYGHLRTATSPRGVQTVYTWDYTTFPLGRLVQIQVGAKTPTSFTYYEPSGLQHSTTGPRAGGGGTATVTFTYDALGNLTSVTTPGNNAASSITTALSYTADGAYTQPAAVGQVLAVTDSLGRVSHYRYDTRGNLAAVADAFGNQRDLTYNIADQPVTVAQPSTGKTGPGRSTVTCAYLFPGGLPTGVSARDEASLLVRQAGYVYGAEGELLATTGNVEATSRVYDALYRLVGFSDGKSQATTYAYHPSGYLASVSYPGGGSTQLPLYDTAGNLLRSIDGRGQQTDYVYNDPAGRLSDIQYTGHPGLNVHLAYDTYGRLQTLTDGQGTESYTYDDGDRGVTKTRAYTGGPTLGLSYGYYPDGSRQSLTTPAGNFSYQYDAAGRLTGMTNPFAEGFAWTYLDNGWLKTQSSPAVTTTWTYNSRGMLDGLAHAGISLLAEWTGFGYNGADNRTAITANVPGASAVTGQTTWGYDSLDRLTGESSTRGSGYSHGFGYDAAGNPTTFKGSSRTFNANNQESGTTYDGNGNPAAHGGAALVFDPLDRLTAYSGVLTAGYTAAGLRAWKQSAAGRTYFLYDGGRPVVETNALGTVTATNSVGPAGLLSRRTTAGSVFYTFDPQGSVVQRLDGSGNVLSQHAFDAYGSELTTPASSDPFGYKAQFGYYTDRETGLQLLTQRYYDPAGGRFLTRDPIGYAGGANLYGYVQGNPVLYADPEGTIPAFIVPALIGAGIGGTAGGISALASGDDFLTGFGRGAVTGGFAGGAGAIAGAAVCGTAAVGLVNGIASGIVSGLAGDAAAQGVELALGWRECYDLQQTLGAGLMGGVFGGFGGWLAARNACFPGGTSVSTPDGDRPIEEIQVGDLVYSASENERIASPGCGLSGGTTIKKVARTFKRTSTELVKVSLADANTGQVVETITGTPEHPFFVADGGTVPMAALGIGTSVITRAGPALVVKSVSREHYGGRVTVYNFEVEDDHTYFVGSTNGGAWVHNTCDIPIHPRFDRFYVRASELLDETNISRAHPLNPEQLTGSAAVGHGGVSNLSNADLIGFGGPSGNDPIAGFRSYPVSGADFSGPGPIINIRAGHHRLFEIGNRVRSGQMSPDTLIELEVRE